MTSAESWFPDGMPSGEVDPAQVYELQDLIKTLKELLREDASLANVSEKEIGPDEYIIWNKYAALLNRAITALQTKDMSVLEAIMRDVSRLVNESEKMRKSETGKKRDFYIWLGNRLQVFTMNIPDVIQRGFNKYTADIVADLKGQEQLTHPELVQDLILGDEGKK